MSTWCCVGQGKARIKTETDKLAYVIGETAATMMTAENKGSELACTGFRAFLIRTIVMRDDLNRTGILSSVISTAYLLHPIPARHPTTVTQSLVLPITKDSVSKGKTLPSILPSHINEKLRTTKAIKLVKLHFHQRRLSNQHGEEPVDTVQV